MKSANVMEYEKELGKAADYHTDEVWGLGRSIDEQHCHDSFIEGAKWSEINSPVIKRLESALKVAALGETQFDGVAAMHAAREALAYLNEIRESVK